MTTALKPSEISVAEPAPEQWALASARANSRRLRALSVVAQPARPSSPRVSIVIPTLNESANISWVLERIDPDVHEVILVDGRSTDDTVEVARRARPGVRVLSQTLPGKGAALALGLSGATGDIVIMIDADGSMDPAEIPGYVGALLSGADVVKGSRELAGGGSHDLSLLRKLGNRGLTWVANRAYRQRWRELCYGYAAFWKDVVPIIGLPELADVSSTDADGKPTMSYGHGFEIEALIFCRAARAGLRVAEVFSFEHARRNGESNLLTWRDGWRVLSALVRECRFDAQGQTPQRDERCYPSMPYLFTSTAQTVPALSAQGGCN